MPVKFYNLLLLLTVSLLNGCLSSEAEKETVISVESRAGGTDSYHNNSKCTDNTCAGENCSETACHSLEDTANGAFTISGTVFDYNNPNLDQPLTVFGNSIHFYSQPNGEGELVKNLAIDAYGNFYTTEEMDWRSAQGGLYPMLQDGDRRTFMPRPLTPISAGQCNVCHSLVSAPSVPSPTNDPENPPVYLRINNSITSNYSISHDSEGTDREAYHTDPNTVYTSNCLTDGCHGSFNGNPTFTMAGTVYSQTKVPNTNPAQFDTSNVYSAGDAAIGLFSEACTDLPVCLRWEQDGDGVWVPIISRTRVAKTYVEIDGRGNFYTTQPIDWTTDTFPTLANYSANTDCRIIKHMASTTNISNCNSCHDAANKIILPVTINDVDASEVANVECVPPESPEEPPPPTP